MSRTQDIIAFKKDNPDRTPAEIAEFLGVKRTLVYSALRKTGKPAGRRGRPRKFVTPVVEMPIQRQGHPEKNTVTLNLLRKTSAELQQVRIDQMEREIENLKTIIRYLEGKLYGAPV